MSCECINQGFFCREYWKNCPKCHGTGVVASNRVRLLTEQEYFNQASPHDPIIQKCLWEANSEPIHRWFNENNKSVGFLCFGYLNTKENDGVYVAPRRSGNYVYFLEYPDENAITYFRGYSKSGEIFLLSKGIFYDEV